MWATTQSSDSSFSMRRFWGAFVVVCGGWLLSYGAYILHAALTFYCNPSGPVCILPLPWYDSLYLLIPGALAVAFGLWRLFGPLRVTASQLAVS